MRVIDKDGCVNVSALLMLHGRNSPPPKPLAFTELQFARVFPVHGHGRTLKEMRPREVALRLMPSTCDGHGSAHTIYFIRGEATGLIKIGRATNVIKRLAALQHGSPDILRLLWCYRALANHEQELHRRFRGLRVHGEWFKTEAPLTTYLERRQPGRFATARRRKRGESEAA